MRGKSHTSTMYVCVGIGKYAQKAEWFPRTKGTKVQRFSEKLRFGVVEMQRRRCWVFAGVRNKCGVYIYIHIHIHTYLYATPVGSWRTESKFSEIIGFCIFKLVRFFEFFFAVVVNIQERPI